jgi:hypothetical protein
MRPLVASDLAELQEIAERADVAAFEAGLLELVRKHVGFDVALFRRKCDYGAVSEGLDSRLLRSAAPFWPEFVAEWSRIGSFALIDRQQGVTTDLEMYGEQRFRRLLVYRVFAKPAGETHRLTQGEPSSSATRVAKPRQAGRRGSTSGRRRVTLGARRAQSALLSAEWLPSCSFSMPGWASRAVSGR